MTVEDVRNILGSKSLLLTDNEINQLIKSLQNIAKIAIDQAVIENILPRKIYESSNLSSYLRRKTDI